ncbi:MAG: cupin domain-containing protein, partial [Pseudomonadota bacterium]
ESSPTISTLWNLTRALNVDFAGLMDQREAGHRIEVLKAAEVPTIGNMGQGCRISILSPAEDAGGHEVYDIAFDAGGLLKSKPHARGATEQLTVLAGAVKVTSGIATSKLEAGDTARYAADVAHEIVALDAGARVFLIVKNG